MIPDFDKNTVDTVAKRAGFICSNPDCRVMTVGPNTETEKSITIGEAAHIYGARSASKRYKIDMTDSARAEITNAIWLCRNCHKLIDSDERKFASEILFKWREVHEKYVLSELGSKGDLIESEQQEGILNHFKDYPSIIKRIAIDKPTGWEFRLTSELMRFLNSPHLRKLKDLHNNLYLKPRQNIEEVDTIRWIQLTIDELSDFTQPFVNLLNRLNLSWGPPGQSGDIEEILHTCLLIRDYIEHIVRFEENLHFTNVPKKYQNLQQLIKNLIGSQVLKIEDIPHRLDSIVTLLNKRILEKNEEQLTIHETITFELPAQWEKQFQRELRKVKNAGNFGLNGCGVALLVIIIFIVLLAIIQKF